MSVEQLKQIWPEWQIEERPIGQGAFGVVYKAVRRDYNVESHAAIKQITIPADPSEVDRLRAEGITEDAVRTYFQSVVSDFVGEIQLMESLKSAPNVVSVEDYKVVEKAGELGWNIFIRMELLTPFTAYSANKKMTEEEVIRLGCDICTALEICEKRKIIHRDIKPENIFINEFGYFKLGDFGIARKMENMTGGLSQKGTPFYMAPEVIRGDTYDARVDIYSLGLVLYRLLNGNRFPFLEESQLFNLNERQNALMRRLRGESLPAPCEASPAVADVILRACAYDPAVRFASASEMKQALTQASKGVLPIALSGVAADVSIATNANETVAVRKAPAVQSGGNAYSAHPAEKKPKAFLRVAAILAVCLLIGGGIAAGFLLGDGNASAGNTSSDVTEYTGVDAEQIAILIREAEALAAQKDYEGALIKIQSALTVYPGAADLMQKEAEYTGLRTAQLKAKALADAQALADAGDYAAAIAQIRTAQQTYGDSTEYQNALAAFCTAYKSAVIAAADAMASAGDYLDAIARINEAAAVTGADEELTAKAKSYEDAYVSRVMAQNDAYIKADNYTAAEADINEALTVFPANAVLLARSEALKNSKPQLMLQVCPPYQTTMGYRARETYTMGGKAYANGFNLHYNSNGAAFFNLDRKYRLLSFDAGHIDNGLQQTGRYDFYLDGVLVKSLVIEPTAAVQHVEIPVRGASQLVVKAGKWCDHYALVNIMVTPDVLVK